MGNKIENTIKVDFNTTIQARGKFARLHIEVDLDKPLLGMFKIKGRIFEVEYEGLHLLCEYCGSFGDFSYDRLVKKEMKLKQIC